MQTRSAVRTGSVDDEPRARRADEDLDVSESFDRYGDDLVAVVDEDWTHRIVNPRVLSPTVDANCRLFRSTVKIRDYVRAGIVDVG